MLAFLLLLLSAFAPGQTTEPAQNAASEPYTLHVYQDLLQMPTLVLDRHHKSYPGLTASQFRLRLDSGPAFNPQHVRLEGDEPLDLALVLDLHHASDARLFRGLEDTSSAALAGWLAPGDHLSVYAVDCGLARSLNSQPYSTPLLQAAIRNASTAPVLHQHAKNASCGDQRRLWDSVGVVISQVQRSGGWRVVMIVSDGQDTASRNTWVDLAEYAGRSNVTLMGLRLMPGLFDSMRPIASSRADRQAAVLPAQEDIFPVLCNETGGVVLPFRIDTLLQQLHGAVDLLRKRYILEFPRPLDATVGRHGVDTAIPDIRAIILSSGLSFPPRDHTHEAEPGTVISDPSQLPRMGQRKILEPKP